MKILLSFFRRQLGAALLLLLLFLMLLVTFILYDLPAEPVLYGFGLCAFIWLIYMVVSYILYRRKVLHLLAARSSILLDITVLPYSKDCIEECYKEIIDELGKKTRSLEGEADQSYHELTDYYTLWAHQIKVPLSALKLLLQSQGVENKDITGELFKIEQYVNMVLQYLRLESLSSDLVLDRYSLDSIVRQAVRNYSTLFITKEISLDLQELNTEVLTDEKWLVLVVEQILSNALKYTPPKGRISIYMDGDSTLCINDTGIGISEENIARVFERGFTGYNGRSDKSASGLGLFLTKEIMKKLSHTIEIESVPSVGTTVYLGLGSVQLRIE